MSESGHWYQPDGTPVWELPNKSKPGEMRKVDLRDARKLGLFPGVTTILRECHREQLVQWQIGQAIEAAVRSFMNDPVSEVFAADDSTLLPSWIKRVKKIATDQVAALAQRGTEIHKALQDYYSGRAGVWPLGMMEQVGGVSRLVDETLGKQSWKSEVPCAHPMGFGTKADLVSDQWLIDFKTKDFDASEMEKLDIYDSHWMQLAATNMAIGFNSVSQTIPVQNNAGITIEHRGWAAVNRRCAIVYVSRTVPGLTKVIAATPKQLAQGWEMFKALHRFWCVRKGYFPGELKS